jgi:hypothetical protein
VINKVEVGKFKFYALPWFKLDRHFELIKVEGVNVATVMLSGSYEKYWTGLRLITELNIGLEDYPDFIEVVRQAEEVMSGRFN